MKPTKKSHALYLDFPSEEDYYKYCKWDFIVSGKIGKLEFTVSKENFLRFIRQNLER